MIPRRRHAGGDPALRANIRGIAANELGRGDETSPCAEWLLELARYDLRTSWQGKALTPQANAHSARGDGAGAFDLLARASTMLGDHPAVSRSYAM